MKFSNAIINGIVVIEHTVFSDQRGYFLESYKLVYMDCLNSNHQITGGAIFWECLKHNYS